MEISVTVPVLQSYDDKMLFRSNEKKSRICRQWKTNHYVFRTMFMWSLTTIDELYKFLFFRNKNMLNKLEKMW